MSIRVAVLVAQVGVVGAVALTDATAATAATSPVGMDLPILLAIVAQTLVLGVAFGGLRAGQASDQRRLDKLETDGSDVAKLNQQRIVNLAENIAELRRSFERMAEQFAAIDARFSSLHAAIKNLPKRAGDE